ncbi:MAG: phosphatidylinositol-specific phospholipase C1-like protein [Acidobacteria bacterium]|nr:phosphatidylinositol-specific phospholipase C1-like protein [Acidobacteriota bacterium]
MLFLLTAAVFLGQPQHGDVRMNQIQIVGTHNSYHAGLAPEEMELLRRNNPQAAASLAYQHPPLEAQLNAGVRKIELDVFGDRKGGLFTDPRYVREAGTTMPQGWLEAMRKPGFKVLHVQDVDVRSHCWTFIACLETVRKWSDANPGHLPLYIFVENKMERVPEPVTAASMDALDAEIRSVLPPSKLVTPDDVRGKHKTLEEAVRKQGWPKLRWARGRIVFLLDQERVTPLYTAGAHASLKGRVMFTNSKPGTPDAAFVKVNDPASPAIPGLVKQGYLVRTMTDGGAQSVREGLTARRDQAIASGAQILSTDYPFDWKAAGSGYHVSLPGGAKARCNPVNAPPGCTLAAPF